MAKDKTDKKSRTGFFKEFKEFISRGNVLDMAVGVIVGGAFTAIVTALTSQILQPLVNWVIALLVGGDGLEAAVTILRAAYVLDEAGKFVMQNGEKVIDLANSIYINWGAFITAIINFFLIALVLFCVVKIINSVRARADALKAKLAAKKEEEPEEEPAAEEPAPEPKPTTEELLTQIRDLLAAQNKTAEDADPQEDAPDEESENPEVAASEEEGEEPQEEKPEDESVSSQEDAPKAE